VENNSTFILGIFGHSAIGSIQCAPAAIISLALPLLFYCWSNCVNSAH